jgi:23S rRNA pseudouridine1911/1915/1917 synthase
MPDPPGTIQFDADRGDTRLRLDQVLVRRVTDVWRLTRTTAQRWIAAGAVRVDGQVASRASARVREGAAIAVALPASAVLRARPAAEPLELSVLYEDSSILVIDKPPGLVVHPSYKRLSGTLLNGVLWRLRGRTSQQPGILTRLDKDTSGLVVVALTPDVHAALQRDAGAGRISKLYLALVHGIPRPESGRIALPLGRDPLDRRRVVVTPGGAPSETRYELIATGSLTADGRAASLVRCELVTGRTHQIRVHMQASGWPVVGDTVYRGEAGTADPPAAALARQALHAWRIALPHPVTREPLHFEAPLPDDMRTFASSAGIGSP